MRLRLAVPSELTRDETAATLDAALEAVTRAAEPLVVRGVVPPFSHALRAGRFRWKPEPPGDEHFDLPTTVLKRGWGDCDDIAPYYAASLRATGADPEASAFVRPSGPNRWHAVVQRSDGRVEDPSRMAGMGAVSGFDDYRPPFWPAMWGDRLSMAAHPLRDGWAARVDAPDVEWPCAWSALARGRTPREAMTGCLAGITDLGRCGVLDDADMARIAALHDLLHGARPREVAGALAEVYGDESVGFLPGLVPAAASLAAPVLSKILPGASAPPGAAPGGGGGGMTPGATLAIPGGPIIVRF